MRDGGYHGASFRDIAADIGIKSASVHHHFPTKEDLAIAVVTAYIEREMSQLGDPHDTGQKPAQLINRYVELFRSALAKDDAMCLCGLLASESADLPPAVNAQVQAFFKENLAWLQTVLKRLDPNLRPKDAESKALTITATLEGALLGAHCHGDITRFDKVTRELMKTVAQLQ